MDFFGGFTTSAVNNYGSINVSSLTIDNSTDFINYGTLNATTSISIKSSASLTNYGSITTPKIVVSTSVFTNHSTANLTGLLQVDSDADFETYTGSTTTFGTFLVKKQAHLYGGQVTVSGMTTINSGSTLESHGACLNTQSILIKGTLHGVICGTVTITATSTVQGSGAISGEVAFVDLSPPGSAPYIDSNSGTIASTVTWVSCGCPGPLVAEECGDGLDNDGDGQIDCADGDCAGTAECPDTDGDGIADLVDFDDDNDGILDVTEDDLYGLDYQPACDGTTMDFTGPPTLASGTALSVGAVYKFTSVASGVDAKVTILDAVNASVSTIDAAGASAVYLIPATTATGLNTGDVGYIEYMVEFVSGASEIPLIVSSLFINFNDIDGNTDFVEEDWISSPNRYTVENPTDLTLTVDSNWVKATAPPTDYGGAGNWNSEVNVSAHYLNRSSVIFRVGVLALDDGVAAYSRARILVSTESAASLKGYQNE